LGLAGGWAEALQAEVWLEGAWWVEESSVEEWLGVAWLGVAWSAAEL
jgi:hypothetical protein